MAQKKIRSLIQNGSRPYSIVFDKKDGLIQEEMALNDQMINVECNVLSKSHFGSLEKSVWTGKGMDKL
jgi:hypothetical protein